MNMKLFTLAVVGLAAMSVLAESEDYQGRWSFSAGPAWRSRVKMSVKGQTAVQPRANLDMTNPANWELADSMAVKPHPEADTGMIPSDAKLWAIEQTRYKVVGTGNTTKDEESPMGANFLLGYDLYQGETLSIGLNARFAGYWGMKSGRGNLGSALETYNDFFIFPGNPPDPADKPVAGDAITKHHDERVDTTIGAGGVGTTRLRGDLYQIGLGPKVTWSPFATSETFLSRFAVYGGVEALCNISYAKLEGAASGSSTDCLLGFGGNLGLVGDITENLGVYGQVGYEWVDKTDIKTGGFKSEIDYSSLVISAGLQYRF